MKRKQKKKFVDLNTFLQQNQQEEPSNHQKHQQEIKMQSENDKETNEYNPIIEETIETQSKVKNESSSIQATYSQKRKAKGKGKNSNAMYELNHLAKFRNYDDDPFLDDPIPKPRVLPPDSFHLRPTKKLNEFEYESQFRIGESIKKSATVQSTTKELNELNNDMEEITIPNEDNILDQHLTESYIQILNETFPDLDRKDIASKICEYNFDIDKVVMFYFNNTDLTNSEFSQYENMVISNIESLSQSFSQEFKYNESISIEKISQNNVQTLIEKEIKKKSVLDQVNTTNYNEKEYPFISEEARQKYYDLLQVSSEYFLDKPIQGIQTIEIKRDLMKLCQAFPFEDEFVIKWVYYQFMDYNDAISFLEKRHFNHSARLKNLLEHSNKNTLIKPNDNNDQEETTNYNGNNNDDWTAIRIDNKKQSDRTTQSNGMKVMEILCKKPINWHIYQSKDDCININEYQSIRSQLIKQANIAWRAGRGKDAKAIMAKARRYKVIIDEMILKRKVKTFTKNNQQYAIDNMYSKKEMTIDLHGLSYEEAIIILKHKLFDESEMNSKRILIIITGKGNNSANNQPILFPKISKWLTERHGIKSKPDFDKGIITIYY